MIGDKYIAIGNFGGYAGSVKKGDILTVKGIGGEDNFSNFENGSEVVCNKDGWAICGLGGFNAVEFLRKLEKGTEFYFINGGIEMFENKKEDVKMPKIEVKVGDKIKMVKEMEGFGRLLGNVFEVTDIFKTGKIGFVGKFLGKGIMTQEEFNEYFEVVVPVIPEPQVKADFYVEDSTLPKGLTQKVIVNNATTIVILSDKKNVFYKGISKCLPEDTYNAQKGYEIALAKALIKFYTKRVKTIGRM